MTSRQKKNLIRIIIATILWIAVYITAEVLPVKEWWIRILMFIVPYGIIGYDVVLGAIKNIINGRVFDEKLLMLIATIGAFVIEEYPEAVAVMLFYQVGELFQSLAVGKSRRSIAALMDIRPESAVVLRGGEEETVSPDKVEKGSIIRIRPGEKIPLDGVIINGNTSVNTSALTGESMPVDKITGEEVYSGSINLTGVIEVETTGVFEESTVAKILKLVESSQEKKAKSEKFITKFAKFYTPIVVICAILIAVIPSLITKDWQEWVRRAMVFLVVSCPCALVISVPLSFFGGIGGASRKGILIKGSNFLETLSKVKTVIFDKTGTLTEGKFEVTEIRSVGANDSEILTLTSLAESFSTHPIAESVLKLRPLTDEEKMRVKEVKERPGFGIEAVIDGDKVFVGNSKLMDEIGVCQLKTDSIGTTVHVARGNEYLGYITVSDIIKKDAQKLITDLKELGVEKTVMLTGDVNKVALDVATKVGITEFYAGLLPEQKIEKAEKIKEKNQITVFVGDGINDAPVLAEADVGIAMGGIGSDAAIEAADVVIMDDKISKISDCIRLTKKTMRIVYQNIIFAIGIKLLVLVLGAVGVVGMWSAVFADVGVAVVAILNAMRSLGQKKKR